MGDARRARALGLRGGDGQQHQRTSRQFDAPGADFQPSALELPQDGLAVARHRHWIDEQPDGPVLAGHRDQSMLGGPLHKVLRHVGKLHAHHRHRRALHGGPGVQRGAEGNARDEWRRSGLLHRRGHWRGNRGNRGARRRRRALALAVLEPLEHALARNAHHLGRGTDAGTRRAKVDHLDGAGLLHANLQRRKVRRNEQLRGPRNDGPAAKQDERKERKEEEQCQHPPDPGRDTDRPPLDHRLRERCRHGRGRLHIGKVDACERRGLDLGRNGNGRHGSPGRHGPDRKIP